MDENDIILTEKKVNFSMGASNPMDKVRPACIVIYKMIHPAIMAFEPRAAVPAGRYLPSTSLL